MGYQVGNTCYLDKELAENVYFSQVPPQITVDGVKFLVKNGKNWYYGSQRLEANLPNCDPAKNISQGFEFGLYLVLTAIILLNFKTIINLLK